MSDPQYNLDELVPPSFLNGSYVQNVLKSVESDLELHLINYEIAPGSSAGDHFASIMFKIIVTYGSKGKIVNGRRFVLKTMPEAEGQKRDILEQMPVFKNEILMYTKTLPAMEEILKEHGEKTWWPKLVFSTPKPFVLIFEDLTMANYQMEYEYLGWNYMDMVVEKMAKFHALSLVLIERGQEEVTTYKMEMQEGMKEHFIPFMNQLSNLAAVINNWPGFEELGSKLEKFATIMADKMMTCLTRDNSNEFRVLNHGDFHIRNLMFQKSDEGQLSEMIFLDFQMPDYSVPAIDLIRLLETIGNYEVREKRKCVIKLYVKKLLESLKLYEYKGELPTVVDIQVGMLRMAENHVMNAMLFGPMFSIKGVELGEFFQPENKKVQEAMQKLYSEPDFIKDMQRTVRAFDEIGVFD